MCNTSKKSKEGLIEIFETMKKFNTFSYLAVLKKFGPENVNFHFLWKAIL